MVSVQGAVSHGGAFEFADVCGSACNIGALKITNTIAFFWEGGGFLLALALIVIIVQQTPKPYSSY